MEVEFELLPKVGELKTLRNPVGEEVTRENVLEQHLDESTFINVRVDTVQYGMFNEVNAALIVFRFIFKFRLGPRRVKSFIAQVQFANCEQTEKPAPKVEAFAPEDGKGTILFSEHHAQPGAVNEDAQENQVELNGWRQSSDDASDDVVVWDCTETRRLERGVRNKLRGVIIVQHQPGQRFQASFSLYAKQAVASLLQRLPSWTDIFSGREKDDPVIFYPGEPIGYQYPDCDDFAGLDLQPIAARQETTLVPRSETSGTSLTQLVRAPKILRVKLIPSTFVEKDIQKVFDPIDPEKVIVHSRTKEPQNEIYGTFQVATVGVNAPDHAFQNISPMTTLLWPFRGIADLSGTVRIDHSFMGLTALQSPDDDVLLDLVAVSGLNGHAFGSWKERGGDFMWLRDGLREALPKTRILIYGYDTRLDDSHSYANISNYGKALLEQVSLARSTSNEKKRPLAFIGHSLGGLVVKEAIVHSSRSVAKTKTILRALHALVFFGVPHRGLEVNSLMTMVDGQANQSLVESLAPGSSSLNVLHENFVHALDSKSVIVHSWYETMESQTVKKIGKDWKLQGPWVRLVSQSSATNAIPGELLSNQHPVNRSHSEMIKFEMTDPDFLHLRNQLHEIEAGLDNLQDSGTNRSI